MQLAGVPDYLRGLADNLDPKETKMTETVPEPECPTCLHLVSLHPVSPNEGVCEGATGPAECDCCWTRAEARREARAESAPEEPVSVLRGALDLGEINRLAADCAASPENRVGTIFRLATQTVPALTARIAELEADVRALGGDVDRMVDPRDHEAAIEAMRQAMTNDVRFDSQHTLVRAITVAEEHMLRMAQASLGASAPAVQDAPAGEAANQTETVRQLGDALRERYHRIAALIERLRLAETVGGPAPEVREVPAGEAREGDTAPLVARIRADHARQVHNLVEDINGLRAVIDDERARNAEGWEPVDPAAFTLDDWLEGVEVEIVARGTITGFDRDLMAVSLAEDDREGMLYTLRGDCTTIRRRPRPVSPLPDQPGAVGTATVRGVPGVAVFRTDDDNGPMHWTSAVLVNGQRWFEDDDLADYVAAPVGAGVDEGGKP
jgi:hypothetical protein